MWDGLGELSKKNYTENYDVNFLSDCLTERNAASDNSQTSMSIDLQSFLLAKMLLVTSESLRSCAINRIDNSILPPPKFKFDETIWSMLQVADKMKVSLIFPQSSASMSL